MPSERELSVFQREQSLYQSERLDEMSGASSRSLKPRKPGLGVSSIGRFLGRNLFLLFVPSLVFGAAATYLILKTPKMFLGEFQLLVEPITSPDTIVANPSGTPSQQKSFDYETLTRLLASPEVLNSALPGISNQDVDIDVNALQRRLVVQRVGKQQSNNQANQQTKLISVRFEDRQPQLIQVVLEELAKRYLQYGEEERRKSLGGGVEFIEKQLPEVRQRVSALEGQMQQLEQKYKISDLDGQGAVLATRSRELEAQRQQIQPALKAQTQLKANLEQQLKLTPGQVVAASQISEDPDVQAFREQLQQAKATLLEKSSTLGDQHPEIIELRATVANLEGTLRQETQRVVGATLPGSGPLLPDVPQSQSQLQKSLGEQLIATINEIQALEIQKQALNQASAAIDRELQQFPAVKRQHQELKAKLGVDRQLLNKLLVDRETFRVQAAQSEVPWQVVKQPTLLKDAQGRLISTADQGWHKIVFATLGGLLLGLGAALLKEKRLDIFYGLDDLKDAVPLDLLGTVPMDKELKKVSKSQPILPSESDEDVDYRFGYPQRMLRVSESMYANLRYVLSEHSNHSFVLGSVSSGDGKTTLAINLAKAVAGMGQRVLLVDANLSSPQLHTRFGLPNFHGLSDILSREIDPNELIQRSPLYPNLSLLTAGQNSRRSSKLLASNQMTYLMEQLHNMFDLVIYDTQHLLSSSSANFLALNAHGLVLVVGIQKTRRSSVLKTLERLRNSRIPIWGMVANFVREPLAHLEESEIIDDVMPNRAEALAGEDEFAIFRVE